MAGWVSTYTGAFLGALNRSGMFMKNLLKGTVVVAAIFIVFIGGCILHYERGTYYYSKDFQHVTGSDDAYIAYRYGWNLVHSHILSWNESGFRRTEGFTDPLWVGLSALWSLPDNKDLLYPATVATGILLSLGLLALEARQVVRKTRSTRGLFGMFLLAASPVVWLHATSGLESLVFGAGSGLLAYYAISEEHPSRSSLWLLTGLALFLTLLRSDGFVYLLILLLALVVGRSPNWRTVVYGGAIGLVGLLLWREVTFGELLPNTAVAKMNFGLLARAPTGLALLIQSLLTGMLFLLTAGIFGLRDEPHRVAAALTIAGWLAYYVYIGGDLFLERHLLGVAVLAAGLSATFFDRILQHKRGWIFAGALLMAILSPLYLGDPRFLYMQGKPQDPWILMGKAIAARRNDYGTIVTFPAGKIPFYGGGDFVDELALNDPELAKVQRPKFIPGHSAGSDELALNIARHHSSIYSYFAFGFALRAENAPDVLLWVNNLRPETGIHHGLSSKDRDQILQADAFVYSLLFRGR